MKKVNDKPQIFFSNYVYPLYVGGCASNDFQDRDEKGSSVLLEAEVVSEEYDCSDLVWSIKDPEIADFTAVLPEDEVCLIERDRIEIYDLRRTKESSQGARRVRAKRTGITEVCAQLPDGTSQKCILTVIDNYSRLTVADIELNAGMLHLQVGRSAQLIPQLYPKDIYQNGMLDTALIWQSLDECVAAVCDGKITAVGNGETDIIVISVDVGRKAVCHVVVTESAPEEKMVDSLNETVPEICKMQVGESLRLPHREGLIWCSEDRYTAAVDENGLVTACSASVGHQVSETGLKVWQVPKVVMVYATEVAGGKVTGYPVMVKAEEKTAYDIAWEEVCAKISCEEVKIKSTDKISSIRMEEFVEIDVDQVYQFHPKLPECAADGRLYWLASDKKAATLDREGNVQGYRQGESRIYAVAADSLTGDQKETLERLYEDKVTVPGAELLQELLEGAVYAECRLKVRGNREVLRNLHVVEESGTDSSVLLLWNRASLLDTGDFDRYVVSCNGKTLAETRKLGYRVEGLEPSTGYRFQVAAVNGQGEILSQEEVAAFTKEESEILNVLEYGALGDGKRTETFFIQRAIDACPKGGTVLLPADHVFVSGALFLKSDMTFRVDGILMGSIDPKDYPRVITRWEGWKKQEQPAAKWANSSEMLPDNHCPYASLLNAGCYEEGENSCTGPYNLENLVICGKGQINANGFILAYNEGANRNTAKVATREYPVKDASSRGSAIRIHNGKNIYLKDVQVAYAPFWTVHTIYCEHITFDGMEVVSQGDGDIGLGTNVLNCGHIFNGDGIDPDSCVHVNIFDILFTTGDDAVAMKSGRGREGNELDKPLAYIRITDCESRWSLGGFGTGSEVSAGAHDILYQNLKMDGALISCIWIKSDVTRGGIVENIQVRDVVAENCNSPVWVYNTYAKGRLQVNPSLRPPVVRHLTFENVHGNKSNELGFRLEGSEEFMIEDVLLKGCSAGGRESRVRYCKNITINSQ